MLCLGICGITPVLAARWNASTVPGAIIYVRPGETVLARNIAAMVHSELPRLASITGVASPGPFPVYAFSSFSEFLRATGINPDLRGVSMSPSGEILLDARGDIDEVQKTLAHELTHSLLNQRLGVNLSELPRWVNEGIACHLSDPLTRQELPAVTREIHQTGLLTLEQLGNSFTSHATRDTDAAYLQSRSMIAWLDYHHPGALRRLIDHLAAGEPFDTALTHAAGLTSESWWQQWEEGIPAYVFWLPLLSSPAIYAPMALLVIIAAIARAIRKRRREGEEEEAVEKQHSAAVPSPAALRDDLLDDQ